MIFFHNEERTFVVNLSIQWKGWLWVEASGCYYSDISYLFGKRNSISIKEKSGNFEKWCLWQPCLLSCLACVATVFFHFPVFKQLKHTIGRFQDPVKTALLGSRSTDLQGKLLASTQNCTKNFHKKRQFDLSRRNYHKTRHHVWFVLHGKLMCWEITWNKIVQYISIICLWKNISISRINKVQHMHSNKTKI